MLAIYPAQLEVLREARRDDCAARLAQLARSDFPADAERLGKAGVDAVVALGMKRTEAHGRVSERDRYLYQSLMFMCGSYFDEDPQLPWVGVMLKQGVLLEKVHLRVLDFLDEVAGGENQFLVRALVKVQAIPLSAVARSDAADFEPRTAALLESIYPTKFAAQETHDTLAVIRHAAKLAEQYELANGAALCAVLAFMLGVGFDRDPMHPWVRAVLDDAELTGDEKVLALHRAGCDFARRALE